MHREISTLLMKVDGWTALSGRTAVNPGSIAKTKHINVEARLPIIARLELGGSRFQTRKIQIATFVLPRSLVLLDPPLHLLMHLLMLPHLLHHLQDLMGILTVSNSLVSLVVWTNQCTFSHFTRFLIQYQFRTTSVKTWKNEHFEYHGQCDMILTKDPQFADGLGLEVQIRTKLVRFWSYIKDVAIRIGDDILEIEGAGDPEVGETRYWMNLEYNGHLESIGGFPVSLHVRSKVKRRFEIDLNSKFPGQKIVIYLYKEFVKVDFVNGSEESYGNTMGMLGDFKTGETRARDGTTVIDDFTQFGNEWQVRPFEDMLFHDISDPQFPKRCIEPEDPQGERRRRLDESTVSEEQAEKACAQLQDPWERKDCVYDILATQDLDMVGAF
jgi:hypothetical protein